MAKASFYARAGIEDHWIVNLVDRALEIYRTPAPGVVAPLAIPSARLAIADLVSSR